MIETYIEKGRWKYTQSIGRVDSLDLIVALTSGALVFLDIYDGRSEDRLSSLKYSANMGA